MPPNSLSGRLGEHIVRDRDAHDLSRNPEFASFQFLGYRTTAAAVELVALCDADGLTEGDIVRRRDEFFDLVRRLPHDYGLKPRGRNPNGLLAFVYAGGCPEHMARFIARQTRISHAAGTGGVSVAWAIDVPNGRIHTHDNPVSIFPPVIVAARLVYPGLDFLQALLSGLAQPARHAPEASAGGADSYEYDLFISYASEDREVAGAIAHELAVRGVRVWLDTTALKVGDSLRRAVEDGLTSSRFGLVLLSANFFRKEWPRRELDAFFTRETIEGRNLLLPVWHQVDAAQVARYSPILADRYALETSAGIPAVVDQLSKMFRPTPIPAGAGDALRAAEAASRETSILFVAASTGSPMDLEREFERIETSLRLAKVRDRLVLRQVWAASIDRLMQAMLDDPPTIVHFAGHGEPRGIVLRDEGDGARVVSGEALAGLFALFAGTVKCVVLNSCWSEPQARAIRLHVPHVIGMRDRVHDDTSIPFSTGFYKAIAAGRDVPFAFQAGVARVQAEGRGDEDLPVLL